MMYRLDHIVFSVCADGLADSRKARKSLAALVRLNLPRAMRRLGPVRILPGGKY